MVDVGVRDDEVVERVHGEADRLEVGSDRRVERLREPRVDEHGALVAHEHVLRHEARAEVLLDAVDAGRDLAHARSPPGHAREGSMTERSAERAVLRIRVSMRAMSNGNSSQAGPALRVLAALRSRALPGRHRVPEPVLSARRIHPAMERRIRSHVESLPGLDSARARLCAVVGDALRGRVVRAARDRGGVARVPSERPVPRDGPRSPARRVERAERGDALDAGPHGPADRHQGRTDRATPRRASPGRTRRPPHRADRRGARRFRRLPRTRAALEQLDDHRAAASAPPRCSGRPRAAGARRRGAVRHARLRRRFLRAPIACWRARTPSCRGAWLHARGATSRTERLATHASRPDGSPDLHSWRQQAQRPHRDSRIGFSLLRLRRMATRHLLGLPRAGFPDQIRHGGGDRTPEVPRNGPVCALLCGTAHYYAWDIVTYNPIKRSLGLLDELVALFEARTPAPEGEYSAAMFERRFPAEF